MKQPAVLLFREQHCYESILYFQAEGERQASCICRTEACTEMADLTEVGQCLKSINLKSKLVAIFVVFVIKTKQWLPQDSVHCCQAEA